MTELILLASRARGKGALLLLVGLLSGASGAALVWLISETLSRPLSSGAALFTALVLIALLTRIGFVGLMSHIHQGAVFALRRELSRRILESPLRRLEEAGSARLQAALTVDVLVVSEAFRLLPAFFINLTSALGCLGYLAWLSPPTFVALLAFGVLGVLSYWVPTQAAVRVAEAAREREDDLFRHIRGMTEGLKELGLNRRRREAFLAECIDQTATDLRHLSGRTDAIYGATASWGLFLFFVLIGLVLFALPRILALSVPVLTGYAFAILYLQQPLSVILETLPIVGRGGVALRKIRALDLTPDAPPPHALPTLHAKHVEHPRGPFRRLELRGVTHAYHREQEDHTFTLGPIDLTLQRGELVFLIGGNGSGKTTLAKILTGLYPPETGELRLNGALVTTESREQHRQYFSAVFSDFHLFESLLGAPSDAASLARIKEYLRRLHLDRKIEIVDGRFSTTALSQGQRKRLALLSAYVEDRPVYVFDEWAADQDPAFKAVFYEELLPELKGLGKTVLVITHDDRYFHAADRLLRLDAGQLTTVPMPHSTTSKEDSECRSWQSA